MDTELKDLYQEVYKHTGWGDEPNLPEMVFDWTLPDNPVPQYTSDYILNRLQRQGLILHFEEVPIGQKLWYAEIEHSNYSGVSDAPLKSLLKLVLSLYNANLLPHEEKE